jgi:hypothetical protein
MPHVNLRIRGMLTECTMTRQGDSEVYHLKMDLGVLLTFIR